MNSDQPQTYQRALKLFDDEARQKIEKFYHRIDSFSVECLIAQRHLALTMLQEGSSAHC